MTLGPTIEEARFDSPKRPKNWMGDQNYRYYRNVGLRSVTHHVVKSRRRQLCHHRLRKCIIRRLEQTEDDVVSPVQRKCSMFTSPYQLALDTHQNSHAL